MQVASVCKTASGVRFAPHRMDEWKVGEERWCWLEDETFGGGGFVIFLGGGGGLLPFCWDMLFGDAVLWGVLSGGGGDLFAETCFGGGGLGSFVGDGFWGFLAEDAERGVGVGEVGFLAEEDVERSVGVEEHLAKKGCQEMQLQLYNSLD